MKLRRNQSGAIGLYRGASRACLVRLSREGGEWRVVAEQATESSDDSSLNALLDRLDGRIDDAIGLAIDGAHGLYRRVDLPPAEPEEAGRIIAAQVETMVPGQMEQVRWSWSRATSSGPAVAFVSTNQQIERAMTALPADIFADAAIPEPFTLDALLTSMPQARPPTQLAVVATYVHHTQLMVYDDRGLALVETLDTPHPTAEHEADAWVRNVADLIERSVREWSSEQRPTSLMCLASAADASPLREGLCKRLGLTPVLRRDVREIKGLAGDHLDVLIAVGSAIIATDTHDTRNLLSDPQRAATTGHTPRRPAWIAAAVWLLAALAVMYAITLNNAERYEIAIADSDINTTRIAALNRSVTLARYLETQGPTFLTILDEIGQVTQGLMLDEIRYDREGQITISGTLSSADALNDFAGDLAGMNTIDSVQIRNQSVVENDRVNYTLVARPSTRYFGGFVEPPPIEDQPSDEDRSPKDKPRPPDRPRPDTDADSVHKPAPAAAPESEESTLESESEVEDPNKEPQEEQTEEQKAEAEAETAVWQKIQGMEASEELPQSPPPIFEELIIVE